MLPGDRRQTRAHSSKGDNMTTPEQIVERLNLRYPLSTLGQVRAYQAGAVTLYLFGKVLLGCTGLEAEWSIRNLPAIDAKNAAKRLGLADHRQISQLVDRGRLTAISRRPMLITLSSLESYGATRTNSGNRTARKGKTLCE
jgi:hypothetical protein